jgi:hypothetical protein
MLFTKIVKCKGFLFLETEARAFNIINKKITSIPFQVRQRFVGLLENFLDILNVNLENFEILL